MAPPNCASENPILFAIRSNRLLDQIRHSDSSLQVRRTARLVGDLAAITSTLTMSFADLIFRFMSGEPAERLQQRFSAALQAVDTINDLCAQPLVLRDWFFSEEHCHLTARLLGAFTGSAGVLPCPPDHGNIFSAAAQPALLEEAPFLNTIFFLMLSRDLPPLALAQCLARARFGYWSNDRRTFFSDLRQSGQGLPIKWGIATRDSHDLGTVHITFQGDHIVSFRFMQAWPAARFRPGRHFMDSRFRLPAVDNPDDRSRKIFRTVRASDGLQHAAPFWHRYFGTISAELESILDGHFTVAKNGLPVRPIFQRNHPSWEDNAEAQEVLISVLSEWFNAGSLEYVERLHRLPHCILAIGRVPKNTAPFHRIVTDGRPINRYAEIWRMKYATVGDICLMLTICALIWIRDLKNAYHLVRLGGCASCRGQTERLFRWITNHDGTGYVPAPTFRSGYGPGDCLGFCDKSFFGMCVAGHVARFAVAQFGHKVSNGPLWVITNTVCSYASRVQEVDADAFVDDLINSIAIQPHGACDGLTGGCPICLTALERATLKMKFLDKMMKDCGLEYSDKGDLTIRQDHLFIGIIFDALHGKLLIAKEKFDKTMKLLHDVMHQAEISPRGMAKLRGKFQVRTPVPLYRGRGAFSRAIQQVYRGTRIGVRVG
jgi:hypothetical protein